MNDLMMNNMPIVAQHKISKSVVSVKKYKSVYINELKSDVCEIITFLTVSLSKCEPRFSSEEPNHNQTRKQTELTCDFGHKW